MSTEHNKALIREAFEGLNRGKLDEAAELLAPDFAFHDPANPQVRNRQDYTQFLSAILTAFAPQFTIDDLIAEGDRVVARFTLRGEHTGLWRNVPPTGKAVTVAATATYQIVDGKLTNAWQNADLFGLMQQLGLLSTPG